jgi:hypothetical protein
VFTFSLLRLSNPFDISSNEMIFITSIIISYLTLNNVDDVITSSNYIYCFINEGISQPMIILDKTFQVRTIGRMAFEGKLLQCYKSIAIYVHLKKIKFVDCSVGHVISELYVEGYSSVMNCRFNGELLAVRFNGDNWLRVWRVENDYSTITLIKEININCDRLLEMDDKYIVVRGRFDTDVHFICTKTLEIERKFYVGFEKIAYEQSLLFILGQEVIRIWDAASGTYLNDLDIPLDYALCSDSGDRIKANSKFLVVPFENSCLDNGKLLCVYDLEALKRDNCFFKRPPLHKINVPYSVYALSIDETHIVYCEYDMTSKRCFQRNKITVLDFRPVDCRPIDPLYC